MKIRKVTALIDADGPDLSGQWVRMLSGTTHLVLERDVPYFQAHTDAFTVSAAYSTVEALVAALVSGAGAVTLDAPVISAPPVTTSGNGAKNGATVSAVEFGDGVLHKTVLTCTATPLTFGDEGGQGQFGGVKVYDFPVGLINIMGAVIDGTMTLTAPAINTWNGDIGLGVEAPTDHQDAANKTGQIMPKVSTTTAVAKVATVDAVSVAAALTESGARWRDGTSTAVDLFLNLLIDDDAAHDNTITGTFTGTITVLWANLGTTA